MSQGIADWTWDTNGRSNASPVFNGLCDEVESLIRASAHSLIAGDAGSVARLIVAQLAHVHGLVPSKGLALTFVERLFFEEEDWNVATIRSRHPEIDKKEIYNALAYLTRTGRIRRTSYGVYTTRGVTDGETPQP